MKILILYSLIILCTTTAAAQKFEGAHMMPSFSKKLDEVGTVSLAGRKMGWSMTKPNPEQIVVKKILSDAEGISYALLLIKSPTTFKLSRDDSIPNVIYTTSGSIIVTNSKITNQWELLFFELPLECACQHRCKVYELF